MTNIGGELSIQLVDENCKFDIMGLSEFNRKVNLSKYGRSYAVVAVMGPQSSGKSTLLNHLFHTSFKEMNENDGRSKTTKGIWLARCPDIKPLTLVIDIEGTDGSERGEDTAFEKRSALFALAIADVVLINMWCKDIGLNHAANKPLLKIVFQQVLLRFCDKPRKITLMFVVRDKSKTPEEMLEYKLNDDIQKIWSEVRKPPGKDDIQFKDFFKVECVFLSHFEYKLEQFEEEVERLKQRFVNSTAPGRLVGDQKEPASGFTTTAKFLWDDIMANKNLNLPSLQVMVATIRCDEIKEEKFESFKKKEVWAKLYQAEDNFNLDIGKKINSCLNIYLSEYDAETAHFHEPTRKKKKEELKENLLKCVQPAYQHYMDKLKVQYFRKFSEAFDRISSDDPNTFTSFADDCMKNFMRDFKIQCEAVRIELANWDISEVIAKLELDMKLHINKKGEEKLDSKIRRIYEPDLKLKLSDHVRYLLCKERDPSWSKVRTLLNSATNSTVSQLNVTLSEFAINEEGRRKRIEHIKTYATDIVVATAREESGRAKTHMKKKLHEIFKADRNWKKTEEINSAARDAKYQPMDVLVGLTAVRLEDDVVDDIGPRLCSALLASGDPDVNKIMATYSWAKYLLVLLYWKAIREKAGNNIGHKLTTAPLGIKFLQYLLVLRHWKAIREKAGNNIGHTLTTAVLGTGDPNTLRLLNSSSWPQVPSERTLIKPNECKQLWDEYLKDVEDTINKTIKDFEKTGRPPSCCDCDCGCCTIL